MPKLFAFPFTCLPLTYPLRLSLDVLLLCQESFLNPGLTGWPLHCHMHSTCPFILCSTHWNSCSLLHDCLFIPSPQIFWALGFASCLSVLSFRHLVVRFCNLSAKVLLQIFVSVPSWSQRKKKSLERSSYHNSKIPSSLSSFKKIPPFYSTSHFSMGWTIWNETYGMKCSQGFLLGQLLNLSTFFNIYSEFLINMLMKMNC